MECVVVWGVEMKIVINDEHGGFGLSKKAYEFLGMQWDGYGHGDKYDDDRSNPKLVNCIEALGRKANGYCSHLKVVEIPDDVKWQIEEYDGLEWVAEKHRTWT